MHRAQALANSSTSNDRSNPLQGWDRAYRSRAVLSLRINAQMDTLTEIEIETSLGARLPGHRVESRHLLGRPLRLFEQLRGAQQTFVTEQRQAAEQVVALANHLGSVRSGDSAGHRHPLLGCCPVSRPDCRCRICSNTDRHPTHGRTAAGQTRARAGPGAQPNVLICRCAMAAFKADTKTPTCRCSSAIKHVSATRR